MGQQEDRGQGPGRHRNARAGPRATGPRERGCGPFPHTGQRAPGICTPEERQGAERQEHQRRGFDHGHAIVAIEASEDDLRRHDPIPAAEDVRRAE